MTQSPRISRVRLRGADADIAPLEPVEEGAEAVVAVGPDAVEAAVLDDRDVPVFVVGDERHATAREDIAAAAEALACGNYRSVSHPVLAVSLGTEQVATAVFDVTLMTAEPARISEYALAAAGDRLFEVRADGVVASTPLGSSGYGRAAGGPVVEPGGGLSVVPVAPFSTRVSPWVVPGPLTLHVERDDGDVTLFVDGTERGTVDRDVPVDVTVAEEFTCLRPRHE